MFTLQGSQGINALIKSEVTVRISHPLSLSYLQSWLWLGKQKLQTESFIKIKYQLAHIICVAFQENYSLIITSNYDMTTEFSWKQFSLHSLSCHQKYYMAKPQYYTAHSLAERNLRHSYAYWWVWDTPMHTRHQNNLLWHVFTIKTLHFSSPFSLICFSSLTQKFWSLLFLYSIL